MREPRYRCTQCERSRPESETTLVQGFIGGDFRRSKRRGWRRVCRDCTQHQVDYARTQQEQGFNTPLNTSRIVWEQAARHFGIDIAGLRTHQMTDRRA